MSSTFEVKRVPYLNIEDTIDEVGITRRQLDHWEDQGLLHPELGPEAKKYTVKDLRRLKALRHLIVDRKLPLPFVKELVDGGVEYGVGLTKLLVETSALFGNDVPLYDKTIDVDSGRLVDKEELARKWWLFHLATASEREVQDTVYDLVLLLFRIVKARLPMPAAFSERRDVILSEIATLADVARADAHIWGDGEEDAWLSLSPALPDDKEPNKYWFHHRASRLNKLRDALIRNDAPWLQPYHARFWAAEDLERMSPHWKPPKPKEEESDAKTDVDG